MYLLYLISNMLNYLFTKIQILFSQIKQTWLTKTVFLSSFAVPVLFVILSGIVAPLFHLLTLEPSKSNQIKQATQQVSKPDFLPEDKRIQILNCIDSLELETAFQKNQLELAKYDSINLTVNLKDSLLTIQLKGVPLQEMKIQNVKTSLSFNALQVSRSAPLLLSSYFTSERTWSTIPKIPIQIIQAPEDTLEALKRADERIQIERPDVYFTLKMDRNFLLHVKQKENPSIVGFIKKEWYENRYKMFETKETIKRLFLFQGLEQQFWITIELSREDAKSVYRSIPTQVRMSILI